MAVIGQYDGIVLNNFGDIKNVLRDAFLRVGSESAVAGTINVENELRVWINKCYLLFQDYEFKWMLKKDDSACLSGSGDTVSGTSLYRLPILARDKKPIAFLFNSTHEVKEYMGSMEAYLRETFGRASTGGGTPRRFAYMEPYTTVRAYSTGTIAGTAGEYTITGTGTEWLANLFCGSTITPTAGSALTIARVDSDTQVTLTTALAADIAALTTYAASTTYPQGQIDLDPIPASAIAHTMRFYQKLVPMIKDSDVPLLPLEDRGVLADGAYSLYKWFHNDILKSGITPGTRIKFDESFMVSPASVQKFFNLYVARMLANERKLVGPARPKLRFRRGY